MRVKAAGELIHAPIRVVRELDALDGHVDIFAASSDQLAEVPHIRAHRDIGVNTHRLACIAHAVSQCFRACRDAQYSQRAGRDVLDADDRAHQRGFPTA